MFVGIENSCIVNYFKKFDIEALLPFLCAVSHRL